MLFFYSSLNDISVFYFGSLAKGSLKSIEFEYVLSV